MWPLEAEKDRPADSQQEKLSPMELNCANNSNEPRNILLQSFQKRAQARLGGTYTK